VQEQQRQWLAREYESDDPHIWQRNNAAALGFANAYAELKDLIENLPEPEMEKKIE
jgi:hypothetical protein